MDRRAKVKVLGNCKDILGTLKPRLESLQKQSEAHTKKVARLPKHKQSPNFYPEATRVELVRINRDCKEIIDIIGMVKEIYTTVQAEANDDGHPNEKETP